MMASLQAFLTGRQLRGSRTQEYSPVATEASWGASSPPRSSLGRNPEDGLLEKGPRAESSPQLPWWRSPGFLTAHLIIFVIYVGILFLVAKGSDHDRFVGLPLSPAASAIEWQEHKFSLEDRIQEKGSFSGKPRPDLDQAWHDLLNAENIVIEKEYMKQLGREDIGVAMPDGSGFLGTLNVYHEIHCLKRIHQFMYPDYYFADLSEHDREMNRLHNEHCIDFLRQSAMCHGDVGLITFEWHEESRIPVANATSHQCVNWDKLDRWTKARTVDMMKPGWLVHPTKGVAYPEGKGDKIGAVEAPHIHS